MQCVGQNFSLNELEATTIYVEEAKLYLFDRNQPPFFAGSK